MAIKKCEMPQWKPLDDSLAKTELFKEVDVFGGPRGYCHRLIFLFNVISIFMGYLMLKESLLRESDCII